jgi:hypothetical protein
MLLVMTTIVMVFSLLIYCTICCLAVLFSVIFLSILTLCNWGLNCIYNIVFNSYQNIFVLDVLFCGISMIVGFIAASVATIALCEKYTTNKDMGNI